ncbi:hypothetical protein GCM10009730_34670 [Streptomyces albidochromogenes]
MQLGLEDLGVTAALPGNRGQYGRGQRLRLTGPGIHQEELLLHSDTTHDDCLSAARPAGGTRHGRKL